MKQTKKPKNKLKKEVKQIVEIHVYVHNYGNQGGTGVGYQYQPTRNCPICGNPNCGQLHVTC